MNLLSKFNSMAIGYSALTITYFNVQTLFHVRVELPIYISIFLIDISAIVYSLVKQCEDSWPVLLFSKRYFFGGYFDPENVCLDNENK